MKEHEQTGVVSQEVKRTTPSFSPGSICVPLAPRVGLKRGPAISRDIQKCVAVKPLCGDKPSTIRLTQVAKAPKSFKSCADSTPSAATQPG